MQYTLNTDKFITPVYEMKYLLKRQHWNRLFSNFIDTHIVILCAYTHNMLKTYNNICFMNQKFVLQLCLQSAAFIYGWICNFNFMPVYTSKRVAF